MFITPIQGSTRDFHGSPVLNFEFDRRSFDAPSRELTGRTIVGDRYFARSFVRWEEDSTRYIAITNDQWEKLTKLWAENQDLFQPFSSEVNGQKQIRPLLGTVYIYIQTASGEWICQFLLSELSLDSRRAQVARNTEILLTN